MRHKCIFQESACRPRATQTLLGWTTSQSGTLPPEAFTGPNKLEIHEVFQDSSRPDLEPEEPGGPMKFH